MFHWYLRNCKLAQMRTMERHSMLLTFPTQKKRRKYTIRRFFLDDCWEERFFPCRHLMSSPSSEIRLTLRKNEARKTDWMLHNAMFLIGCCTMRCFWLDAAQCDVFDWMLHDVMFLIGCCTTWCFWLDAAQCDVFDWMLHNAMFLIGSCTMRCF